MIFCKIRRINMKINQIPKKTGKKLLEHLSYIAENIGSKFIILCDIAGSVSIFFAKTVASLFSRPFYFKELKTNLIQIGFYSLPVVAITAIFTGAVLALQTYTGFSRFNAESSVATVVVLSITRELGPVLAGLMVAGRVASSIAASIGTMKVTEQIDALRTLSTNPFSYLILPRVLACTIAMPILVLIADILGVMGGYITAIFKLDFNGSIYLTNTVLYLEMGDVLSGLYKSVVFGLIIGTIGCYHGYYTKNGAQGVGQSTIYAVVNSSILLLCANYFLTEFLFSA